MTNRDADPQDSGSPLREPANSTVDDWLGQRAQRDEARAEQALEEADGDVDEAEGRFEESSREGEEYRAGHEQGGAPGPSGR
jgi:hypothetical protein